MTLGIHFIATLFLTLVSLLVTEANAKGGGGKGGSGKTTKGTTSTGGSSGKGTTSSGESSTSGGDGSSSSSGSTTSKGITSGIGGTSGGHIIYVGGSSRQTAYCMDSITNQTVPCPASSSNHKRDVIIAAVLCSVFGAIAIGFLAWFLVKRRLNRRQYARKTASVSPITSQATKGVYQKLEDPKEEHTAV